jgi:hypothetical protein
MSQGAKKSPPELGTRAMVVGYSELPRAKTVRAEFGFYFCDGYGDQGDDA